MKNRKTAVRTPVVPYQKQLRLRQQFQYRDRTYYEVSDNTAHSLADALSQPLPMLFGTRYPRENGNGQSAEWSEQQ